MNKEKVIELARQAQLPRYFRTGEVVNIEQLERFAAFIEAEVHEKNARLCDSLSLGERKFDERFYDACRVCADTIRSQA